MVMRRNNEQTVAGRHRMMRRADREVADPQQVEAIIATCKIVSLAYTDAEGITIVPLNFGYVFDTESNHLTLYFHGSATGRKMDAVKAAGNALPVAFEMATDCEVVEGRTLCSWGEAFKSIVGNGTASIIDNLDEARQGLALLMKQQAGMELLGGFYWTKSNVSVKNDRFVLADKPRKAPAAYALKPRGGGAIIPGKRANLVMVNPNRQFVVDANALLGRNPISAFDGVKLDGVISRTIIGGRP